MSCHKTPKELEALKLAEEIKKLLLCQGVWLKVQEEYVDGGSKFIKFEASIKVG